jgi:hypothetical protein
MSKLTTITIVNQEGTRAFYVGQTYGGLLLHRIENETTGAVVRFRGYTGIGEVVFETANAPVVAEYERELRGEIPF